MVGLRRTVLRTRRARGCRRKFPDLLGGIATPRQSGPHGGPNPGGSSLICMVGLRLFDLAGFRFPVGWGGSSLIWMGGLPRSPWKWVHARCASGGSSLICMVGLRLPDPAAVPLRHEEAE